MAKLQFIKLAGGMLRPANQADADALQKIENGALLYGDFIKPRNPKFHRKFFALLDFAYDYFEPELVEIKGMMPEKSREKFRDDALIMAGYHDLTVNLKGEARYIAKSISFASMDDIEFEKVYSSVFNVLWRMVLQQVSGMTKEVADNTIMQMISFDG